jgi:diguanylate cyclase (GGDEF)-like protein/PAS domain S-box-containing protein
MTASDVLLKLRDDAEKQLALLALRDDCHVEADSILHELQVRQIELEMQNEALRQAHTALSVSHDRYTSLYNFAPVGYLSLCDAGLISEVNFTGLALLGADRRQVMKRRFSNFVASAERDRFERFFCRALAQDGGQTLELHLLGKEGKFLDVLLSGQRHRASATTWMLSLAISDLAEQKQAESGQRAAHSLALTATERERFIKSITDALPGMVGYWDRDLRCRFANRAYVEWFGKSPEALSGAHMKDVLGEGLFTLNEPYIRGVLDGTPQNFERSLTKADGSIGHVWSNYIPDVDPAGGVTGFFVLVSDVTPLKHAEAGLRLADSVYQHAAEGIFVTDADGTIRSVNPAFTEITGYSAHEAIGQTPRILKSHHHDREFHVAMWREIVATGEWKGEVWNRRKCGEVFLEWQTISRIDGSDGEPCRYIALFHDITDAWRKDERVRHLAFHDALTDLPNRALLTERLERKILMASREPLGLAVMFLDLDGFKLVNDTLGHAVGDALLKAVAQEMQSLLRQTDTVARLGGDEFAIVLANPSSRNEVAEIALRIVRTLNAPMQLGDNTVRVGASLGVALFPGDGATPAELIRNADAAMYAAKNAGKNCYRFFDATLAGK